jgi:hypothetical protein
MATRKISECINVRINVGNYQHIELSKYAEESIEFSSDEERIAKEDQLRDDLVVSLVRSMKEIPKKLGKGIDQAIEVEESIKKAIPEFLEKGNVPNIANVPKKNHVQDTAEQKNQKDQAEENLSEVTSDKVISDEKASDTESDEDLFEEDEMPKSEDKEEEKKEEKEAVVAEAGNLNEFFGEDDEDLFGDI